MGVSSSQRRTDPTMSLINAFSVEEFYTPQFSDSFQKDTGYWQEPNPHKSHIAWTTEEEIALAKGWVAVSENNNYGNARKEHGFWCEVLEYIESKTKQYDPRTYDIVCGKWKTVRPAVIRFCEVYGNVMRMSKESGASGEDYINRALIHYQGEIGNTFKYRHCWEVLKDSPKWTEQELLKFATDSGEVARDTSHLVLVRST
ncbi:hypothetical protein Tco_0880620 [Tanacetum coccineum]